MEGTTVVEKDSSEDVAIKLFGRRFSLFKAVVWRNAEVEPTVHAFARLIWYFGAIGSWLDGITTWFVLTHAKGHGVVVEKNSALSRVFHYLGVAFTCGLRVWVGIVMFWIIGNELNGKIFFFSHFGARRYADRLARSSSNRFQQWRINTRVYHVPFFALFLLVATWAVVGNNLNVLYIWAHH